MFRGFDLFGLVFLFSWLCLRFRQVHSSFTPNWVSYNWLDFAPQNQKQSNTNSISCSASLFRVSFFCPYFHQFVHSVLKPMLHFMKHYFPESVGSWDTRPFLCLCQVFMFFMCIHEFPSGSPLSPQTKGMYARLVSDSAIDMVVCVSVLALWSCGVYATFWPVSAR